MKAFLMAAVACLWLCNCVTETFAQEEKPESKTVSFAEATEAPAEAPAAAIGGRRKFSDRDARRLGITFLSVRSSLKELKASGTIDGSEGTGELAAIVADHISSKKENKTAFAKEGVDWDSLLAFLERLIALIMKLFAP